MMPGPVSLPCIPPHHNHHHHQVRAAALTASQCATYDEVKAWVMEATGWPDSAATHLATAMITGVVSTTATNPVDVIKTYMFVGEWVEEGVMRTGVLCGVGIQGARLVCGVRSVMQTKLKQGLNHPTWLLCRCCCCCLLPCV